MLLLLRYYDEISRKNFYTLLRPFTRIGSHTIIANNTNKTRVFIHRDRFARKSVVLRFDGIHRLGSVKIYKVRWNVLQYAISVVEFQTTTSVKTERTVDYVMYTGF